MSMHGMAGAVIDAHAKTPTRMHDAAAMTGKIKRYRNWVPLKLKRLRDPVSATGDLPFSSRPSDQKSLLFWQTPFLNRTLLITRRDVGARGVLAVMR